MALEQLHWQPYRVSQTENIWVASVQSYADKINNQVPGLFSLAKQNRYMRARYPNGNVELDQVSCAKACVKTRGEFLTFFCRSSFNVWFDLKWGYNSPDRGRTSLGHSSVTEWPRMAPGEGN